MVHLIAGSIVAILVIGLALIAFAGVKFYKMNADLDEAEAEADSTKLKIVIVVLTVMILSGLALMLF